MSASPFTGEQQIYDWQAGFWAVDVDLIPMRRDDAEAWCAFLTALKGIVGTFVMGLPFGPVAPTGSPTVSGASQVGGTLTTAGWTNGIAIPAGTYFQLGTGATSTLHKVAIAATANGSGAATLEIWPGIRTAPANGATIVTASPRGRWRLASRQREWSLEIAQIYGLSFSAIEAI
jgi:hypothetical protein